MKAPTKTFIGVRLDAEQLARIDALAQGGAAGLKAPRSEVIRLALERGLHVLERESRRRSK